MYEHYYTSSDVTVDLYCPSTQKRVNLDTTIGIAYNQNVSSVPVYTLGNPYPIFFSKGNSIVQGQIDLVFTGSDYLPVVIEELLGISVNTTGNSTTSTTKTTTVATDAELVKQLKSMDTASLAEYTNTLNSTQPVAPTSIADLMIPLEIILTFNNTNATMDGTTTRTRIKQVKFTSKAKGVSSQDDVNLVDRLSFLGSNLIDEV